MPLNFTNRGRRVELSSLCFLSLAFVEGVLVVAVFIGVSVSPFPPVVVYVFVRPLDTEVFSFVRHRGCWRPRPLPLGKSRHCGEHCFTFGTF